MTKAWIDDTYNIKILLRQYTVRSRLLVFHLVVSLYFHPNGQAETTLLGCWGADHEGIGNFMRWWKNVKVYEGQVIW